MKIGFIGQGFVGKNMANDFERRGYDVVRYSLEQKYAENKSAVQTCDIVFVAVPTPTTSQGFDSHIVEESLSLIGDGKIAVLKSTLIPGTTKKLQLAHPNLIIVCSPEFLSEATAVHDAEHPIFNIVGVHTEASDHQKAAELVMSILPKVEHSFIVSRETAELFKYTHNIHGFMRVIFSNLIYDTGNSLGVEWSNLQQMMNVDPMMSPYYNAPVHKSGRGAGGSCFIKDMAAFCRMYEELHPNDTLGVKILQSMEKKNLELLAASNKDQNLIQGIYGHHKNNPQDVPHTQIFSW